MRIGSGTATFSLVPVAWEFDTRDETEWNWFEVEGEVADPRGSWTFRDPLFTPPEGLRLADWIEQLETIHEGDQFSFTEPEVRFTRGSTRGNGVELFVTFAYEAAPPWAGPEDETVVCVVVDAGLLAPLAAELRREVVALRDGA